MMKKRTFIMTVVFVMILAMPAFATSLQGMKGIIKAPVADTPAEGKYGLNFQVEGDDSNLSFNYAFQENIEIFASLINPDNFSRANLAGGIKARVIRETKTKPSVAVGLRNTSLFVVASKTVDYKTNIRGHLGFGTGDFDGPFFGFNKLYNPVTISNSDSGGLIPMTNFKVEFLMNEINFGADFLFNQHFVFNLGVTNFRQFTYGIGYSSSF